MPQAIIPISVTPIAGGVPKANALSKIAIGWIPDLSGTYLVDADIGASVAAFVHTHAAADIVSGVLAQARGGTNIGSYTAGDVLVVNDAGALVKLALGTIGQVLTVDTALNPKVKWAAAGGTGTVTSVDISLPSFLAVSGNPITTSGTLALTLASQLQNLVFASPNGSSGAPTFRSLVAADIPDLSGTYLVDVDIGVSVQAFNANTTVLGNTSTGSGSIVLATSPTIVTPTIASFTNATHTHQNAAGGGTLDHGLALTGLTDDDHTQYVILTPGSSTRNAIQASGNFIAVAIKASGTGTPNLLEFQNSSGTSISYFSSIGQLILKAGSDAATPGGAAAVGTDGSNNLNLRAAGAVILTPVNTTTEVRIITTAVTFTGQTSASFNTNNGSLTPFTFTNLSGGGAFKAVFKAGGTQSTNTLLEVQDTSANILASVASTGALTVRPLDAATVTVTNALILGHETSGTPAASYGTGLAIQGESDTTSNTDMARIRSSWTTATHASRVSNLILSVYNVATEVNVLTLAPKAITIAPASFDPAAATNTFVALNMTFASTGGISTNSNIGFGATLDLSLVSDPGARTVKAFDALFRLATGGGANMGGTMMGFHGEVYNDTANRTITNAVGMDGVVTAGRSGSTITNGYGIRAQVDAGTGTTLTSGYMFYGKAPAGAGTYTNLYGLYLENVSVGATLNFAIVTNNGKVVFNEGGNANSDVRIEGDTDANLFFSDASADMVGFKTNAPTAVVDINSDILRLRTAKTPASAAAAGNTGDIAWDSGFVYVCVAASTWKRAAIATW